ncbi:hypothetical protein BX666DRAFT_2072991 [Dichotomocladium elegans]|nr:hypothetical protein BX666DRAFT_2072991 [Dichotomocladium elegans]
MKHALVAQTVSETTAQNKVFLYEPHLVSKLAELTRPGNAVSYDVQTYSLCALDGIARHHGKLTEVLAAFNVSANHGILMHILRKINSDTGDVYPRDFLDALFTLLSCIMQNQPGGQMLMSAGIIPMLVQILGNEQCIQAKYMSRIVSLLDTVVNAFTTSFSAFCNAGGLDTLLARIKESVGSKTVGVQAAPGALAPHDRISAIKAMLKFLLRMMEAVGTADSLRNLIESSVPQSLLHIISHPRIYGASVLTIAINTMTTFIHSEPTSLSILQEAKLPQAFLETINGYDNPNSEVLMACINGFGAICLNAQGIEMFTKNNPLPHFFDLMTDHEFLRNSSEVDSTTGLGSAMDELIRHHPALKPTVFECLTRMIKKVVKFGKDDESKPTNNTHRLKLMHKAGSSGVQDIEMETKTSDISTHDAGGEEFKKEDKTECLLVSFIDMVARFLEGLFQNQSNIREFVKEGCPEVLLDYYTLPHLPADFSVTIASDSLGYIFKMISDVSTLPTIMAIANKVKQYVGFCLKNKTLPKNSMVQPFIDVKGNKIEEGNKLFRQLIILHGYIGLLSNICCSTGLISSSRNSSSLVAEFTQEEGDSNILFLLGQLYRTMMWENFLLKDCTPNSWYSFNSTKKTSVPGTNHPLGIFGVEVDETSPMTSDEPSSPKQGASTDVKENAEEKTPDTSDPRIVNIKHFKLLLGDIPQFLMPIFQGLVKVSITRNATQAQKAQAFKLAEVMTRLLKENLTWLRADTKDVPACKYDYLATMYTMVSLLLLEDRPHASLHTPLALTFDRRGGIDLLLQDLDVIWKDASLIHMIPKEQQSKEQQDTLARMHGSLEMLLSVLVYTGSPKLVHDSPSTAPIVVKDRKSPDYFDPYAWMVHMQLKLSSIKEYFRSPVLCHFSKTVLHVLLDIILEILKGEGESSLKYEPFNPLSAPRATPFALRTPVVADERGVQRLVDMGFQRSSAEQAMIRCNNQISGAVDYLFSHPTPIIDNAAGSSRERSSNDDTVENNDQEESAEDNNMHGSIQEEQEDTDEESIEHNETDEDDVDDEDEGHVNHSPWTDLHEQLRGESESSESESEKQELSEKVNALKEIREQIKTEIPPLVLDLVDKREDLLFDIRRLLATFCTDDPEHKTAGDIMSLLISRIKAAGENAPDSPILSARLRLLALFYKESAMQPIISHVPSQLSFLFDMINAIDASKTGKLPAWFTTVFLVVEAIISQADEPKKEKLIKPEGYEDEPMVPADEEKSDEETNVKIVPEQRTQLLRNCVSFLAKEELTKDEVYAILRVTVHLTKDHTAAEKFVDYGGLPLLFLRPKKNLNGILGQQPFIILILRHIIESTSLLEATMEDFLKIWFSVSRSRNMEAKAFVRNNAALVLRNPSVFLSVVGKICSLTHFVKNSDSYNVKLRAKEEAESRSDGDESDQAKENIDVDMAGVLPEQPLYAPKNSTATVVINHLLNELLSIRIDESSDKKDALTEDEKTAENIKYGYAAFILQCLTELVSSYSSCKYDIYAFGRRRGSKDNGTGRSRHSILNMLINDLLPHNAINPNTEESRKQQGVSNWVTNLLVSMCYEANSKPETEDGSEELNQVRKYVLDGIIRSLKEAVAFSSSLATKYGKFLALSDLCHRLLNARVANAMTQKPVEEESIMNVAKLMVEKNFVVALTTAISDVDINYPHAKNVLNSMLRPLEQLTKLAIKIPGDTKEDDKKREEISYVPTSNNAEADEEAPDLYRNSSLGMFGGNVMEDDEMDEFESGEEDEETFDEDEFDEDTGSDLSDMSEMDEEGEDGDQEMEAVLEQLQDGSDEDESDHDTDSSGLLDDSEESDDYDDEGREMTWGAEAMEYDPEIQVDNDAELESVDGQESQKTLEQSDFDEDEDSENLEDGDPEAGIIDDRALLDDIQDGESFLRNSLANDGILLEDDRHHRSIAALNFRRFERPHNRGRLVVEPVVLNQSFRTPGSLTGRPTDIQDDTVINHPLLTESQADNSHEAHISRSLRDIQPRSRSTGLNNWQTFEDIVGGNAMRLLESFFAQAPGGNQAGPFRIDVQDRTGGVIRTFDRLPNVMGGATGGIGSRMRPAEPQPGDQNQELMMIFHDFQPLNTNDRWNQEARMMFGSNLILDKAQKIVNSMLTILIPITIEEEKIRREKDEKRRAEQRRLEEEQRKKEEEERKEKEKEERAKKEEEDRRIAEETARDTDVAMETDQTGPEPRTIRINGEDVDISGTGIDIEFLEALPEDLREEVVSQHMRQHQPEAPVAETDSISPEFLNALPPDIREEVLNQEALERERRDRQQRQDISIPSGGSLPLSSDRSTFENILSDLFPTRSENPFQRFLPGRGSEMAQESTQKKSGRHRSVIQLVDRAELSALARLLFVPQSISKSVLNKLLINLCENSKTRGDLLSFLVCVLHDGSGDLAAVDRSFAQLSLQSKGIYKPVTKPKGIPATDESVPNFITQRCLEFLIQVVRSNEQSLTYFLVENDCLAGLKRTNSKKGKGKEKITPSSKYPLLVLMSLLERPTFVENPSLMEDLMHLIGMICRPFPVLVKKYVEKVENMQKEEEKPKEEEAAEESHKPKPSKSTSRESDRPVPKPPTISDHYLRQVVHVLTSGECSSKTFQYTLSALSHLSALDGAQQTIANELVKDAMESGQKILQDLGELLNVLDNAMGGAEIQGPVLAPFSAASSHQAKLLRVLKTIDYLYSSSAAKKDEEEQAKNEKRILEIYSEIKFLPLWKRLGRCLAVVHEKDELINVATVLLPLIESFMVVFKYSAEKGQKEKERGGTDEDFFFVFTEEHKKILNIMVRNNPSLMIGSFSLLVRNPKMLEFDNKRNYFVQQLHKRTGQRGMFPPLQLNVRRQYVFEDSYHQLLGRTGDEIKYGKLGVRFYDEEGVDAGGVTREWYSVLARQMFDPNYALFITSAADKLTYQPNRASSVNPDHLSYLKFVGRVIGKAIYDGRLMDAYFTRSFYKHILGRQVDYRDVEAIDPEYYKSLVWILENDITDVIDLTFSVETDDFGTTKVIDLKPGGRDIAVTEENKHEYVALVTEQKLTTAIKDQINAFLQGFHDIIPAPLIQIFNEQELELLISGLPDIDIDDWKANTEYQVYTASSPQIQWFWRAVRSFDQEERAKLLQFATGTSKVPLEGFGHLQGSGGIQRFQIHKDFGSQSRLPSAHTCFNQIDLPEYESYETLRSNLFKAINECSTGFGFI